MTIRAAIYLRISLDRYGDNLAIERQQGDCERIIADRGWQLVATYQDSSKSAYRRDVKRPDYDRMVADYATGKFDAIVCWDLDRLSRQPRQLEDWIEAAEERGLRLVTANGEADLSNDNGRLFARIKVATNRGEMERKGSRQKARNEQNVTRGYPVPGKRRYGFLSGNVIEHPEEAPIVRSMFEGVAAGDSLRSWATRVNKPTVRVREILTNPGYAGWVVRKGERFEAHADVARVVDRDLWETVQLLLADPARKTSPGNQPKFLASGIARCATCKGPLVKLGPNYICIGGQGGHSCIKVELLDEWMILGIQNGLMLWADHEGDAAAEQSARERIAALDGTIATAQDLALVPGANVAHLRQRIVELGIERQSAVAELSRALTAALPLTELLETGDDETPLSFDLTGDFEQQFRSLTIERQRELARRLIARLEVAPGRGQGRIELEPRRPPTSDADREAARERISTRVRS